MTPTLLLSFALLFSGDAPGAREETPRKPNPLAPSLPLLTREEEAKLDDVVNRFIQFDTGRLGGDEGKKALEEFRGLGASATFALIRGLNKAAQLEATCPAATIGKKLKVILRSTKDPDLLEYARENIGAGITKSPHMGILKDLRVAALLRKKDVGTKSSTLTTPPVTVTPPPISQGPDAPKKP